LCAGVSPFEIATEAGRRTWRHLLHVTIGDIFALAGVDHDRLAGDGTLGGPGASQLPRKRQLTVLK
jgi:hypothetical protein